MLAIILPLLMVGQGGGGAGGGSCNEEGKVHIKEFKLYHGGDEKTEVSFGSCFTGITLSITKEESKGKRKPGKRLLK